VDLQRLIHAIIRRIWLVALLAIIGSGIFGTYSVMTASPVYQTETSLYIMKRSDSVLSGDTVNLQDIALSRELIKDYGYILLSRRVLEPAIAELNAAGIPVAGIGGALGVGLSEESNVMSISVTWPDPVQAAAIANAVSRSFTQEVSVLTSNNSVGILDEALVPAYPIPSNHVKMIVVGFMAGMIIALGLIYVRELFDNTIRSAAEIENGLDLKVIGIIPEYNIS
jgi:capsular polysaccharide biosynthesis protein